MNEAELNELGKLDPQFTAIVEDRSIGLLGYVVVDSSIKGRSCGGLRIFNDVTIDELKGLARMMTLKYGFAGIAQGGAKAGIVGDPFMTMEKKRLLLKRFGEILSPLLNSAYYISGPDMNTTQDDILYMLACSGTKIPRRWQGVGKNSGLYTALSVMVTAEASSSYKKMDLAKCKIAIEGFGAVGSNLAWLMAKKKGSSVVAISTSEGALYDTNGMDIDYLLRMKDIHGSSFVNHLDRYQKIELNELLTLDLDILFPCARHHSINTGNANQIMAPIICSGANIPITREADEILFQKGVISVPSFVTNCGGVIGNNMEFFGLSKNYIESFIRQKNYCRILNLIRISKEHNQSMLPIAEKYAMDRFRHMQTTDGKEQTVKHFVRRAASCLVNNGFIPEFLVEQIGAAYYKMALLKNQPYLDDYKAEII